MDTCGRALCSPSKWEEGSRILGFLCPREARLDVPLSWGLHAPCPVLVRDWRIVPVTTWSSQLPRQQNQAPYWFAESILELLKQTAEGVRPPRGGGCFPGIRGDNVNLQVRLHVAPEPVQGTGRGRGKPPCLGRGR